jgi:hypothetical protein
MAVRSDRLRAGHRVRRREPWAALRCGGDGTPIGSQTYCDKSDLDPIIHFDKDGHVLKMFGSRLFSWPHGLHVDVDGNIWIAEAGSRKPKTAAGRSAIRSSVLARR